MLFVFFALELRPSQRISRGPGVRHLLSATHLCCYTRPSFTNLYLRRSTRFRLFLLLESWSFSNVPFKRVRPKKMFNPSVPKDVSNIFQKCFAGQDLYLISTSSRENLIFGDLRFGDKINVKTYRLKFDRAAGASGLRPKACRTA